MVPAMYLLQGSSTRQPACIHPPTHFTRCPCPSRPHPPFPKRLEVNMDAPMFSACSWSLPRPCLVSLPALSLHLRLSLPASPPRSRAIFLLSPPLLVFSTSWLFTSRLCEPAALVLCISQLHLIKVNRALYFVSQAVVSASLLFARYFLQHQFSSGSSTRVRSESPVLPILPCVSPSCPTSFPLPRTQPQPLGIGNFSTTAFVLSTLQLSLNDSFLCSIPSMPKASTDLSDFSTDNISEP